MNLNEYIDKLNNYNNISHFYTPHNFLMKTKTNVNSFYRNLEHFDFVYNKLLNLVLNMFEWDLGDNEFKLSPLMIEVGFVFLNGVSLFATESGLVCLPAQPSRKFNIYGEPLEVIVSTANGERIVKQNRVDISNTLEQLSILDFAKGIYQRDFKTFYRLIQAVVHFSKKIADKEVALEILTKRLKDPFTFVCEKEEEATIKAVFEQIDSNQPVIIATKSLNLSEGLEPFNNNFRPELVDAMKESILFDLNEFLEFIGINVDPNPDKAERKLVSEVNSNNQITNLQLKIRLDSRKEFCKKAKKVYGLDIDVKFNEDETQQQIEDLINSFKGEENANTLAENRKSETLES